jgi:hypothetical protein
MPEPGSIGALMRVFGEIDALRWRRASVLCRLGKVAAWCFPRRAVLPIAASRRPRLPDAAETPIARLSHSTISAAVLSPPKTKRWCSSGPRRFSPRERPARLNDSFGLLCTSTGAVGRMKRSGRLAARRTSASGLARTQRKLCRAAPTAKGSRRRRPVTIYPHTITPPRPAWRRTMTARFHRRECLGMRTDSRIAPNRDDICSMRAGWLPKRADW